MPSLLNSQPNLDGTVVPHVKVGTPKFVEADQEIPYHVSDKVVVEGGMVASKHMNKLENLEQHAPDLAFELPDGKPVVRLGLILTLYFKRGYTNDTKKMSWRVSVVFMRNIRASSNAWFMVAIKN